MVFGVSVTAVASVLPLSTGVDGGRRGEAAARVILFLGVGNGNLEEPVGVDLAAAEALFLVGVRDLDLRGVGSLNLDRVGRLGSLRGGGPLSVRVTEGDGVATGGSKILDLGLASSSAAAAATAVPVLLLMSGVESWPLLFFPGDVGGVTLGSDGVVDLEPLLASPITIG